MPLKMNLLNRHYSTSYPPWSTRHKRRGNSVQRLASCTICAKYCSSTFIATPCPIVYSLVQTELERERSRKDGGDSAWIERTRQTEAELDWAKEMADRLDRVNQGLSGENLRLKSQFKSQEDDRKFLIRQLVAVKVSARSKTTLYEMHPHTNKYRICRPAFPPPPKKKQSVFM